MEQKGRATECHVGARPEKHLDRDAYCPSTLMVRKPEEVLIIDRSGTVVAAYRQVVPSEKPLELIV